MSIDGAAIEAAINAAIGQSDRGALAPMNQIAIGSALTAVATIAGLGFVSLLPWPSTVAAAPEYTQADQAASQAEEERFERLVLQVRLLKLGEERREFGAKEFPAALAATPGKWGAK